MKTNNSFFVLFAVFAFALFGCKGQNSPDTSKPAIDVPSGVKAEVKGRWFYVSWDEVGNAGGYKVYTTSAGCNTGNRIINAKTKSAVSHKGVITKNVEYLSPSSIRIFLMADDHNEQEAMTGAISAKVMALAPSRKYRDSDYSQVQTITKENYLPAE
jgi:hypothetical protein